MRFKRVYSRHEREINHLWSIRASSVHCNSFHRCHFFFFFFFFFEETQDFPSFSPHHFFPVQKVYKHLRATEVLSAFVRLRAPIRSIGRVTAAHVRSQKTIVI